MRKTNKSMTCVEKKSSVRATSRYVQNCSFSGFQMVAKFKEKERDRSSMVLNARYSMEGFVKKFFDGPAIQKQNLEEVKNIDDFSCKLQCLQLDKYKSSRCIPI